MTRLFGIVAILFCAPLFAQEISVRQTDSGYDVLADGKLFAGYVTDYQNTPIVWPVIGPGGQRMTRDFPMANREDGSEATDHPHHRSFWFNHGEVNDCNFWHMKGEKIVHDKFLKAESDGKIAVLVAGNTWLDKSDKPLCRDERTLKFMIDGKMRVIDFEITVTAVQDEVVFKETKEGTFAMRVPGTMKLTAKKNNPKWGGRILNAEGLKDGNTWGKRSTWVDYSGPVEGSTAGIAILNHPSSFRFPTYWHVRDYGLFAANPFGDHDFDKNIPKGSGEHRMKKGDSFTLRYRILLHDDTVDAAGIAEAYRRYARETF